MSQGGGGLSCLSACGPLGHGGRVCVKGAGKISMGLLPTSQPHLLGLALKLCGQGRSCIYGWWEHGCTLSSCPSHSLHRVAPAHLWWHRSDFRFFRKQDLPFFHMRLFINVYEFHNAKYGAGKPYVHVLSSQWSPTNALLWLPIYRWGNWGNESKLPGQRHIASRWQSLGLMSGCLSPEFMLPMCLVGFPQGVSISLVLSVASTLPVGASGENRLWAAAWYMAHSLHLINICWVINSLVT